MKDNFSLVELRDHAGETLQRAAQWLRVSVGHLHNVEKGFSALTPEQDQALRAYYLSRIAERMNRLAATLKVEGGIQDTTEAKGIDGPHSDY